MKSNIKLEGIEISDEKGNRTEERKFKEKKEQKISKKKDLSKKYLSPGQKAYKIHKYADNCEEHNQISFILPLIKSTPKFVLYIILNIFTVSLINLFIAWFPKLNLYLYYKVIDLETATHFGVFSKDNELLVVKKKEIIFPEIENEGKSVIKKFNLNINYKNKKAIMFEYKLFDYIYITEKEEFTAVDYKIKDKKENIIEENSTGLNLNVTELMQSLFGISDEEKKEKKETIEEKEINKEENEIKEKKKRRHKNSCRNCGKIHFNCFCCEDPETCPIHGHL